MDLIKKIEITACVIMLALAGYFVYAGTRPQPDPNITGWVEEKKLGIDARQPISDENPMDPKRSYTRWTFSDAQERLLIDEFPLESGYKAVVSKVPAKRKDAQNIYMICWKRVANISDPTKRALAYAGHLAAERRSAGLLRQANLTEDQEKKITEAYSALTAQLVLLDEDVKAGIFEAALQERMVETLDAYRAGTGDINKDPRKKELAARVMSAGSAFLEKIQARRAEAIEKYAGLVYEILDSAQREVIATEGEKLAKRAPWKPRSKRTS